MGKIMLRRKEVTSIVLRTVAPGRRAVFLVETRGAEDQQKVRELFEALAKLGEVALLAEGPIMAYAMQLRSESEGCHPSSFFSKIEATLKDEFPFSLVEQAFNDVIYHLVESLCLDSGGRMHLMPRCGICNQPEPFPTRITLRDGTGEGIVEACYCTRCAALRADPSDKEFVVGLLADDRRGFRAIRDVDLIEWPTEVEAGLPSLTYRIAS
jgi:hypothetical protein